MGLEAVGVLEKRVMDKIVADHATGHHVGDGCVGGHEHWAGWIRAYLASVTPLPVVKVGDAVDVLPGAISSGRKVVKAFRIQVEDLMIDRSRPGVFVDGIAIGSSGRPLGRAPRYRCAWVDLTTCHVVK